MNLKRIALFLGTNFAILVTLSLVVHLLGFNQFVSSAGLNFVTLLGFAALLGFGGAFISLAMPKWVAIRSAGAVRCASAIRSAHRSARSGPLRHP
jgi:heat shock protein HtpX